MKSISHFPVGSCLHQQKSSNTSGQSFWVAVMFEMLNQVFLFTKSILFNDYF